jgi:BirA family transcriptional regulator, biotin operon repressor / biotin---[acetyl-CoA-carboxylase] ligase
MFVEEIDSTNIEARRLAQLGEKEGTVVIAASQVKGHGRLGRRWISPPGGLYLSIILKPYISPSRLPVITLLSAVAVVRTIKGLTKLDASVKWPNDIAIMGKKVGGILCEASKNIIIVGIGINLNTSLLLFPSALKKQVTSVKFELGASVDRDKVIKILLEEFDKLYRDLLDRKQDEIVSEWSSSCQTFGSWVKIETPRGFVSGIAEKIGPRGELRVRGDDGKIKNVSYGDVIKVNLENI